MSRADEDTIRELENRFNAAWDRHDPEGMAKSLVDDAQFITVNGAWTTTRAGFRDLMARLPATNAPFRNGRRHQPATHRASAQRTSSRRVVLRPIDELDHAVTAVEFERKPRDRPGSVFLDRLQKNHACRFRAARRKAQGCRSGCAIESDRAGRKAGRDRRAENIGRYGTGLKCGDAELVSFGMFEEGKGTADYSRRTALSRPTR